MKSDRCHVITTQTTAMTYTKFTSSQRSNDTMNNFIVHFAGSVLWSGVRQSTQRATL